MKILIVDDEIGIDRLYQLRFRKEIRSGLVELLFAHSGMEAIDMIERLSNDDNMVILADINMPRMNGLELLERVKTLKPEYSVFIITAYGDEENRRRARELGASGYLLKPLNFHELKERLNLTLT